LRPRIRILATLVRAVGVLRDQLALFFLVAAVIELPLALVALVTTILTNRDIDPSLTWKYGIIALVATAWSSVGHHALSALGERIVSADRERVRPRFDSVVTDFPWVRVIAADVLVTIATVVGLVLLVLPGIALMVYLAPMFPLLNMERRPVVPTARRSFSIVRGHFWKLATLLVMTQLLASAVGLVGAAIAHALGAGDELEVMAHFLIEALLTPFIAVVVVVATFDLVEMYDRSGRGEPVRHS
jgi:hypothetical protein